MAQELGLFARHGLTVELQRETSWAQVRDKVIYGELDAAHAPAALPFAANFGLGSDQCACVSGMVLNLQGNAITISRGLWERDGVFADERAEEHERLIAALIEACRFCDQQENRVCVSECLVRPGRVNAPAECVRAGLAGPFDFGDGRVPEFLDLNIFNRDNANDPTDEKAAWVMECLYELLASGTVMFPSLARTPVLKNVFRRDVFRRAKQAVSELPVRIQRATNTHETQSTQERLSFST
jgi:ABC-type nitrate/sulfonate/bicarbonate transport system substrate-binding protein